MVMLVVNVTTVPVHTIGGFAEELILIDAGTMGLTPWVMEFEVTGLVIGQGILEVSWQVITCPPVGT